MNAKSLVGHLGEELACRFLEKKGFLILQRNYREKWGEIDVISRAPDGTLVFVEVKALRGDGPLAPEDHMSSSKLEKVRRTSEGFANGNKKLINEKKGWRIDLIAIMLPKNTTTESTLAEVIKSCIVNHYENV